MKELRDVIKTLLQNFLVLFLKKNWNNSCFEDALTIGRLLEAIRISLD